MDTTEIVNCSKLTKDYGQGQGLFDLDLSIYQGEVFGLIGPNGAGKSTFIRLLMDLIRPTSGTAKIFGLDSRGDSLELKHLIGYQPGEIIQFPSVTAGYILNLLLNLRKVSDRSYLEELAERFQLELDRKFQDLSHGNKQKVGLIQAFMHRPKLLILDEPTLGLDPLMQRELRKLIQESCNEGRTVLLSSHVLSEVENVCSRIGLINQGQVIKVGTLEQLRTSRVHKFSVLFSDQIPSEKEFFQAGAENIVFEGKLARFEIRKSVDPVLKEITKYQVIEIDSRELSLEEVFFSEVKE